MANKYTKTPNPPREEIERLYFDEIMTQSEIAKYFNVTQRIVWRWFRDLNIKSRIPYKRNQEGKNNDNWKADNATYAAFHYRVERMRGKPFFCEVCGTMDAKRYEWCNLTGKYEDIMDYARMCISCHRKYDKKRRELTGKNTVNVKRKA